MQGAKQTKLAQNAAVDRRKDASLHAAAGAGGGRASRAQAQLARRAAGHRERDAKVEAKANAKAGKVMREAKQKVRCLSQGISVHFMRSFTQGTWVCPTVMVPLSCLMVLTVSWLQPVSAACSMDTVCTHLSCPSITADCDCTVRRAACRSRRNAFRCRATTETVRNDAGACCTCRQPCLWAWPPASLICLPAATAWVCV
jgi:hypothetical protein